MFAGLRFVVVACAAVFAMQVHDAKGQTKWDLSTYAPENEFSTVNTRQFANDVKKASGGQLEIVVHPGASLIRMQDQLRAVSTGQVNLVEFFLSTFGNEDAVFNADNLPFVAVGYDSAWKFYQAQKPTLEKSLRSRGLRLLYSVPLPGQGIFTKAPVKSAEDLRGVKFRTYSPLTARLAELLGAVPVVINQPEVPQAFATGTIGAMITSSAGGAAMRSWEFLNHFYVTNAFHPKNAVVVNERAFKRLSEVQRNAITASAGEAERRGWQLSKDRDRDATKIMIDNGIKVQQPDAMMMAQFQKVGETILQEWLKSAGADGKIIIDAYRKK